jgi:hypothetical protein
MLFLPQAHENQHSLVVKSTGEEIFNFQDRDLMMWYKIGFWENMQRLKFVETSVGKTLHLNSSQLIFNQYSLRFEILICCLYFTQWQIK